MNTIPQEFQISSLLIQDTYLLDGELKKWTGETSQVYSTISSTAEYKPTLLGAIPFMGEKEAMEANRPKPIEPTLPGPKDQDFT